MAEDNTNAFRSPFESGEWGGLSNAERRRWLEGFLDSLKAKRVEIEQGRLHSRGNMK